jgi:hypothetical protein
MRDAGGRDVRHLNYFIDPIASGAPVPRDRRELVYIGRLEPEKGVAYLIEAMPSILAGARGVHLTIVGGGSLAGELETRAEDLDLRSAVTFLSHVPRAELGRFYATATACVLPSIWSENSPLVAYECLAAGLPMLASRIGGIPELAEDGVAGFTFQARDSRDLAEKALRLLSLTEETRERMSSAMRVRALDFGVVAHIERLGGMYAEVLARPRAPAKALLDVDRDLFTILGQYGEEKRRLGSCFREHVAHIGHLEQSLAALHGEAPRVGDARASLDGHPRERNSVDPGPTEVLQRLARALRLPKVFKR